MMIPGENRISNARYTYIESPTGIIGIGNGL
jgi:hypothetical protein